MKVEINPLCPPGMIYFLPDRLVASIGYDEKEVRAFFARRAAGMPPEVPHGPHPKPIFGQTLRRAVRSAAAQETHCDCDD